MMVKYDAIVVMEDLNVGFKRGRFKVERQVYQKFEKALIDKLNYLVTTKDESEYGIAGSVSNAYQLTEKFKSFKDMGKQNGMLFYMPDIRNDLKELYINLCYWLEKKKYSDSFLIDYKDSSEKSKDDEEKKNKNNKKKNKLKVI